MTRDEVLRSLSRTGCYPDKFSGQKNFRCPECSDKRKPSNKRKKCLTVTVKADGIVFYCHNCDFNGGFYNDGRKDTRTNWRRGHGKAGPESRNRRPIGDFYR